MLIQNYGLFWNESDVFWGAGSKAGRLLGVPSSNITAESVDFREQAGVYVLYADYDMVYVGQVGAGTQKLLTRLKQHTRDSLAGRWNKFSWFGVRWVKKTDNTLSAEADGKHSTHTEVLDHIEAILIHSSEPKQNRQGGRFGDAVTQYLQKRDELLGPTRDEMIHDLWKRQRIADNSSASA
jgi:predicted GIY-YIG superfamily endonuclease